MLQEARMPRLRNRLGLTWVIHVCGRLGQCEGGLLLHFHSISTLPQLPERITSNASWYFSAG
jgi:hypothetical protein